MIDRNIELLGLSRFRKFVANLPSTPDVAIAFLLQKLGVPERLWETVLLCQAFTIPGWSAWAKYQVDSGSQAGAENSDLTALLAIRLAYDVALSESAAFSVNWSAMTRHGQVSFDAVSDQSSQDALLRYTLLRASELGYQRTLIARLKAGKPNASLNNLTVTGSTATASTKSRKLAQMVFCIDVTIRAHASESRIGLQARSKRSALPVSSACRSSMFRLGETKGSSQVPVLLKPQFQMHEGLQSHDAQAVRKRSRNVLLFGSCEKPGNNSKPPRSVVFRSSRLPDLLYGVKLLMRATRPGGSSAVRSIRRRQATRSRSTWPDAARPEPARV